jgi:hypothetical protein
MKINEGLIDRSLRISAGMLLLCMMFFGAIGAWGWIGLVPLATGLIGWCPLYSALGMKTCEVQRA